MSQWCTTQLIILICEYTGHRHVRIGITIIFSTIIIINTVIPPTQWCSMLSTTMMCAHTRVSIILTISISVIIVICIIRLTVFLPHYSSHSHGLPSPVGYVLHLVDRYHWHKREVWIQPVILIRMVKIMMFVMVRIVIRMMMVVVEVVLLIRMAMKMYNSTH